MYSCWRDGALCFCAWVVCACVCVYACMYVCVHAVVLKVSVYRSDLLNKGCGSFDVVRAWSQNSGVYWPGCLGDGLNTHTRHRGPSAELYACVSQVSIVWCLESPGSLSFGNCRHQLQ